jgi:phage terminase large subunit
MFDFFQTLKSFGLYSENNHNKTENTYELNGNLFRFFSVDMEQKVRGSGRAILWLNEANEFTEEEYKQLNQRTSEVTILDYNPSDLYHWIYEKVLTRPDCAFFQTSFMDNPFLPERIRKEILAYKDTDENYWRIYGLGERGLSESTIFTHWKHFPGNYKDFEGEELFGLDFGFNHPTALVRVKFRDRDYKELLIDELLHKSGLTSALLIEEMKLLVASGKLKYSDKIICDSARPEIIQDLYRAGFNVHSAKKENGSVLRGINFLKISRIWITGESSNLLKEFKSYSWKVDKQKKNLDEPVDINDDGIDAVRYALEEKSRNKKTMGASAV